MPWTRAIAMPIGPIAFLMISRHAHPFKTGSRAGHGLERSQSSKLPRPYGAADPTLTGPGPSPALTLRLTNTLTRAKADFVPLQEGRVSIYCCGVTVYDLCHLGHARSYIVWDVLRRYLIWLGYQVTYVQIYTDIDD